MDTCTKGGNLYTTNSYTTFGLRSYSFDTYFIFRICNDKCKYYVIYNILLLFLLFYTCQINKRKLYSFLRILRLVS